MEGGTTPLQASLAAKNACAKQTNARPTGRPAGRTQGEGAERDCSISERGKQSKKQKAKEHHKEFAVS